MKKIHIPKIHLHKKTLIFFKSFTWFAVGVILGFFFLVSFTFIAIRQIYKDSIFPGVSISGVNVGGKSKLFIQNYFDSKNALVGKSTIQIQVGDNAATVSAKDIHAGYDSALLADQAFSIGRSDNVLSNMSIIFQSYLTGISLPPSYTYDVSQLETTLKPLTDNVYVAPTDAVFQFTNGRVTTFKPSEEGQQADIASVEKALGNAIPQLTISGKIQHFTFTAPLTPLKPKISTQDANNLGIKELIGTGTSLFQHSIDSRIYNVELAASRLNGIIVKPGEEFSFDKALGDVSAYTGYKQAYVISGGHTVLGDGGGVCQVSTTLFRAILNAGLPITERHAHDYRVGYYEEDGPPGIDATVYVPTVDLKFKNDTNNSILIQSVVDPDTLRLTFYLYGTSDGRQVSMTTPVVTNQTPAPAPLYQDDPTLPKGVTKQIDFAANGATVSFSRTVTKNGSLYIHDTYTSNYRPWQAIFLVGTGA